MANWMAGHTDRFKCLISHAGVFNLTSEYGVTEELWFDEWEFKGTPWTNREAYEKWSPHHFAKNFKTPMLVIHGELDFRVPIGEGFSAFHLLAASWHPFQDALLSGRRPLDTEAGQQPIVVQDIPGVAG